MHQHQLVKSLFVVMMAILVTMSLFETTKQLLIPGISILESHVLTVIFSTLTGTVIAGYALIKYQKINRYLGEQILERERLAAELRNLNDALELKVQERTKQLLTTQNELVRKEKLALLGQLADNVGHELRNPLGVMNNAVYFLQTVLVDADETTKEYLGIIKDEITNADRIVSDLLNAVRTKPPHPEIFGVAELIQQILRKCAIPPSVRVQLDIPANIAPIRVDPIHMHQVLWNLVTNALEAMPEGGELEIKAVANPAAQTVTISIRDSGSGIAPEHLEMLFQPMFTTKTRRIGLGLVVVKNLTQVNSGSVGVESSPGKGSVLSVTLPSGS